MKLLYRITTQPECLWVRVIRAKYAWKQLQRPPTIKRNASHLMHIWESMQPGLSWNVGDGQTIRFWLDSWIDDLEPLINLATAPLDIEELNRPLQHYVTAAGQWNLGALHHTLPHQVLNQIAATNIDLQRAPKDECYWNGTSNGEFNVSSAYALLMKDHWNDKDADWDLAWRWPGAQRIQTFLWLALHDRLLTNNERMRRHMTMEMASCVNCGMANEDLNHVFRSCNLASSCWKLLIPDHIHYSFFSQPFSDWFKRNLKSGRGRQQWCTMFGIMCWKLWSTRNNKIFRDVSKSAIQVVNEVLTLTQITVEARESKVLLLPLNLASAS